LVQNSHNHTYFDNHVKIARNLKKEIDRLSDLVYNLELEDSEVYPLGTEHYWIKGDD